MNTASEMRSALEGYSSEQLARIVRDHDDLTWRPETFEIAASILEARGVSQAEIMTMGASPDQEEQVKPLATLRRLASAFRAVLAASSLTPAIPLDTPRVATPGHEPPFNSPGKSLQRPGPGKTLDAISVIKVIFLIGTFCVSLVGTPEAFLQSGRALNRREPLRLLSRWFELISLTGLIGLPLLIPRASRSLGTFLLAIAISGWAGVLSFALIFVLLTSLS